MSRRSLNWCSTAVSRFMAAEGTALDRPGPGLKLGPYGAGSGTRCRPSTLAAPAVLAWLGRGGARHRGRGSHPGPDAGDPAFRGTAGPHLDAHEFQLRGHGSGHWFLSLVRNPRDAVMGSGTDAFSARCGVIPDLPVVREGPLSRPGCCGAGRRALGRDVPATPLPLPGAR
jgi:hypothetical protein